MKPNKEKEKSLSIDRLDEILSYDENSGELTSLVPRGPIRVGQRLGCLDKSSGYRYIMIEGTRYLEHRLVWFIMNLEWPSNIVDHIDGNRSNNVFSNLRDTSYRNNSTNKVNNNELGCNITKQHGNFMVTLYSKGTRKSYGTYKTLQKALYIRDIVANHMDDGSTIPSKSVLKEMAEACA